MQYEYPLHGVCAKSVKFSIGEDKKVHDVLFNGGCAGNSTGLAKLIENRDMNEVIELLRGVQCKTRGTSCPDQLTKALLDISIKKAD